MKSKIDHFMRSLILETSSSCGLIAFMEGSQIIASMALSFGVRESADLVTSLQELLLKSNLKVQDFDQIILGTGPGSFTGLRIGASVAKAFSYVHDLPIIGISSLKLFAPLEKGPFVVLLDAKQKGICIQKGAHTKKGIEYEPLAKTLPAPQALEEIKSIPLWVCSQKKGLEKKFESLGFSHRLKELAPCPEQMLKQAALAPKEHIKKALEHLNLQYFDAPC